MHLFIENFYYPDDKTILNWYLMKFLENLNTDFINLNGNCNAIWIRFLVLLQYGNVFDGVSTMVWLEAISYCFSSEK